MAKLLHFVRQLAHRGDSTRRIMRVAAVGAFAATPFLVVHGFSASPPPTTTTTTTRTVSSRLFSENNKNTLFNVLGDMTSSILGKAPGGADAAKMNTAVEMALSSLSPSSLPDWPSIRKQLESRMETDDERNFRGKNLAKGYGVAGSPLHKLRLYDETNKEEDVRVTFYRDSASWCPYCQKVWLVLEEKRIPYRVEKINMRCYGDKPNSFLRLQPNGNIPVCIIDGRVYGQSNDIMYALEEIFSSTSSNNKKYKSLSPLPEKSAKANELLSLEREVFGAWMQWLTGSARSKCLFVDTLKRVERELAASSNGPFFMGKDVTLVDFMYASFLERMAASLLYFKGFQIRVVPGTAAATTDYPAINRWFDAMETLESYRLTKSDYYTHCWDLPPQLGGCTFERPAHEPYTTAINGERIAVSGSARGSWDLPLQPHNGGVEPDWDWIPLATAKRQAVERVSANHEAIVAFASRGAGRAGFPPVEAPLADPNAVPNAAVQSAIDAILRAVCVAILESSNNNNDQEQQPLPDDATMTRIAQILVQEGGGGGTTEYARNVVDSLSYLRDRIGVPRDMTLPAARQLRAHLNWAIDRIVAQQLAQQK